MLPLHHHGPPQKVLIYCFFLNFCSIFVFLSYVTDLKISKCLGFWSPHLYPFVSVQHECIPQAILGMDVICQAKSGMGKTAVFVLATLQQLEPVDGQVGTS